MPRCSPRQARSTSGASDGALAELDAGARLRRRAGPPPVFFAALLGDLDEARGAARRRPVVAVFEALGDPFGDRAEGDAALVVGVLGRLQQRVEAVAQLGAPGAAAVGGVEGQIDGDDSQRRLPVAETTRVLEGRVGHRRSSSSVVVGVVYPGSGRGNLSGARGGAVDGCQASRATRKPMLPVELSGVLKLRAATR